MNPIIRTFAFGFSLYFAGPEIAALGIKAVTSGIKAFNKLYSPIKPNFINGFRATYADLNNGIENGLKSGLYSKLQADELWSTSAYYERLETLGGKLETIGNLTTYLGIGVCAYAAYKLANLAFQRLSGPPVPIHPEPAVTFLVPDEASHPRTASRDAGV